MTTEFDKLISTPEGRVSYCVEQAITNVTELLARRMEEADVSQADLAKRMGVSPGRVCQLLDGNANMTLRSVAKALAALDQVLIVNSSRLGEQVAEWTPLAEYRVDPVPAEYRPIRFVSLAPGATWQTCLKLVG